MVKKVACCVIDSNFELQSWPMMNVCISYKAWDENISFILFIKKLLILLPKYMCRFCFLDTTTE